VWRYRDSSGYNPGVNAVDLEGASLLGEYISSLPKGLDSYPESKCKGSVIRGALDALPGELDFEAMPEALAEFIQNPPPPSSWVPETCSMSVYLAVADQLFPNDERAFSYWVYGVGKAVFQSPMYRILMLVASPARLAKGAQRRWGAFHQGSEYLLERHEWGTLSKIKYQPYLFPRLGVVATSMAIKAAYRASGARKAKVEVVGWTPTEATIRSEWAPELGDEPGAVS
jgi:hypothetical protein